MPLPSIPRARDLAGDWIPDRHDDMINPPGLTNHLVTAQVDHDVVAVRSVNAPPLAQGDRLTAQLYLDGRLARSFGGTVEARWRPDRVDRRTEIDDWSLETATLCPPGERAVMVRIHARNLSTRPRPLALGLRLDGSVTAARRPWLSPEPPEADNVLHAEPGMRVFAPEDRAAACLQALLDDHGLPVREDTAPDSASSPHLLSTRTTVEPGGVHELWYVQVLDETPAHARQVLDRLTAELGGAIDQCEKLWDTSLAAMFTPGNDEFGGSLPRLVTEDASLRRLYWWGALGVLWFRRDNPASVLGRTYDTLMPRYWQTTTFIWDYSLSSLVHALLDPQVMRRQISHWTGLDIERHFGTEWLTGGPVGNWYSVNHFAMTRLVDDYLRWHGDPGFLDEILTSPEGTTASIAQHIQEWALAWMRLRGESPDLEGHGGSALADYGGIDNLLECVSSYTHQVASLNAANVWTMRAAADIAEHRGETGSARSLRSEADALIDPILDLAVEGQGWFRAGRPDGTSVEVRHVYDFATIGTTIAQDLPEVLKDRMVRFFVEELRTPTWMRALSPKDADAGFSLRADHQWNGAYPAWPPDAARAAIALGHPEAVLEWLPGLARSTNQGPPGQAHFVEDAVDPVQGGARKAPPQLPYILDWSCSSAGAWCDLVIRGIFGVRTGLDGSVTTEGCLERLDPGARLEGLMVQGSEYRIDVSGAHLVERGGDRSTRHGDGSTGQGGTDE
ncbi:hypothetical protein [Brachybacterium kimchii]|uniref:Uncharacterized protein n=1 Tax=Brachybacterium kimchii TaxID=2942909 RepID=A0ABY4N474_9MICO|nr:hypothetical protein [Brachybacterium kimchii]UQN28921.1 hypothetical protein M4486_14995 [Brachybacterium kimchii]